MTRNLTGSKRIIYDCSVDLYNIVQKWKSVVADSHSIIMKIWTLRQESNMSENNLNSDPSVETYVQLENLSSELHIRMENLELLIKKFQGIVTKLRAITELSGMHQSGSNDMSSIRDCIPFKTWSLSKFSSVAQQVTNMFEEEMKVKSAVAKEICLVPEKNIFLFFEACWKFQPSINECKLNMLLERIICELNLFSEIM